METDFWLKRWQTHDIGFHESKPNPLLTSNFDRLSLPKGSRVFLPLCGKTLDIAWLLANGYQVTGVELVRSAIDQLFAEIGIDPEISTVGELTRYSGRHIDIYVGDIFNLSSKALGQINAVYDRAALVALPKETRRRYTTHLMEITKNAPQLLICYEYDQEQMDGPPFSVIDEEIAQHYGENYHLDLVASSPVFDKLKRQCKATEKVWLLNPLSNE